MPLGRTQSHTISRLAVVSNVLFDIRDRSLRDTAASIDIQIQVYYGIA